MNKLISRAIVGYRNYYNQRNSETNSTNKFELVLTLCFLGLSVLFMPSQAMAEGDFDCEPIAVIERSNRIGVECLNPFPVGIDILAIDWIKFVTFPKTDVAQMERFMDVAMRALIEDKYFRVYVLDDPSTNLNGCESDNCRTVSTPFSIRLK